VSAVPPEKPRAGRWEFMKVKWRISSIESDSSPVAVTTWLSMEWGIGGQLTWSPSWLKGEIHVDSTDVRSWMELINGDERSRRL